MLRSVAVTRAASYIQQSLSWSGWITCAIISTAWISI